MNHFSCVYSMIAKPDGLLLINHSVIYNGQAKEVSSLKEYCFQRLYSYLSLLHVAE